MIESAQALMEAASELDGLSKRLMATESEIAVIETKLRDWEEMTHASYWDEHVEKEAKLPSEAIRLAKAHQTFDRDEYRKYLVLKARRNRDKQRLADLREIVAAHRSIVSAAKTELEATEGPQPAWTPAAEAART